MKQGTILGGLLLLLGAFVALPVKAQSEVEILQPAKYVVFNENVEVNGEIRTNSLRVGEPKKGGVTYFNGTIISEGMPPVTFGDDVRIDGAITRGTPSADMPVKVNDDMIIDGTLTINGNIDVGNSYIASHWLHADGVFGIWVLRTPNREGTPTSAYPCDPGNIFMDTTPGSLTLYGCNSNSAWEKIN